MELAESNIPRNQHTSPNRRMSIKQDYFDLVGFHWSVQPRSGCKIGKFESRKKEKIRGWNVAKNFSRISECTLGVPNRRALLCQNTCESATPKSLVQKGELLGFCLC